MLKPLSAQQFADSTLHVIIGTLNEDVPDDILSNKLIKITIPLFEKCDCDDGNTELVATVHARPPSDNKVLSCLCYSEETM